MRCLTPLILIYFFGRIITILAVGKIWKDKIYTASKDYSLFNIIDYISGPDYYDYRRDSIQGVLVSKEGM